LKAPYKAVGRLSDTVDYLLTAMRDMAAARQFLDRAIKRLTRTMLGFKSFWYARSIIACISTMLIIRK